MPASGVCETRGSYRAVAGGLGKGLAGKSSTQRATQVAAGEFSAVVGFNRANELRRDGLLKAMVRIQMVQAPVIMATTMVGDLAGDITWYFDGTAVTVVIKMSRHGSAMGLEDM
jgi:hypothetical protein